MIHNSDAFLQSVWNWNILHGCFSATRTAAMDLDGLVERKGQFLVFETKALNARVSTGQQITFNALSKTGLFTVVIVWGNRDSPEEMEVMYPNGKTIKRQKCNLSDLRDVVSRWYAFADQK